MKKILFLLLLIFIELSSANAGNVNVKTDPVGANVYLDDIFRGASPVEMNNVERGNHTIFASLPQYQSAYLNIFVENNLTFFVFINLSLMSNDSRNFGQVGNMDITTNPSGASIYLDGIYQGVSPIMINSVSVGTHRLEADLQGYNKIVYLVEVSAGQTTMVMLTLSNSIEGNTSQTGSIYIATNPISAAIFLDNSLIGNSPLLVNNVVQGFHNIRGSLSGYDDNSQSINVAGNQTIYVYLDLVFQNNTVVSNNSIFVFNSATVGNAGGAGNEGNNDIGQSTGLSNTNSLNGNQGKNISYDKKDNQNGNQGNNKSPIMKSPVLMAKFSIIGVLALLYIFLVFYFAKLHKSKDL
ncbi:MAG: PEGA domain-containing protein [Nanoarchaeota archaeon]